MPKGTPADKRKVNRRRSGAMFQPEDYEWLMNEWLPVGELTLVVGSGGVGKSSLTTYLGACAVGARAWPDGTRTRAGGKVVFVTSEERPTKGLAPQMLQHGVDGSLWDVYDRPAEGLAETLRADLAGEDIRLIVVDPLEIASDADTNTKHAAQDLCQQYSEVARALNTCVIGIKHSVKYVRSRVREGHSFGDMMAGSGALRDVARMLWVYINPIPADHSAERILWREKINATILGPRIGYSVRGEPHAMHKRVRLERFTAIDDPEGEVRAIMQAADEAEKARRATEDGALGADILEYLEKAGEPVPARECLEAVAEVAGRSVRSQDYHAARLIEMGQIIQEGGGKGKARMWSLPAVDDFPDDDDGIPF